LKAFVAENKIFLTLYLLFLITGGILILKLERGNEILYFNSLHTLFFDQFFKWVTRVAEAPVVVVILVASIRFGYKNGALLALNALLVFALTATLKEIDYFGQSRPAIFFSGKEQLHFVEGVLVYTNNTFPSGHTSTAFALFFMLSILIKDKRMAPVFFVLALLVGISRVYLLEHFFRDVYFGSLLGVLVTSVFYLFFTNTKFYKGGDTD
jgi:membrane-associated phospholipid phosphatase